MPQKIPPASWTEISHYGVMEMTFTAEQLANLFGGSEVAQGTPTNPTFPPGLGQQGAFTVKPNSSLDLPAGEYYVFHMTVEGELPVPTSNDPTVLYQYAFVMESDSDSDNNYETNDADYFNDTDRWYELDYTDALGWRLFVKQWNDDTEEPDEVDSSARVIFGQNCIVLVVPKSEFPLDRPPFRVTTFCHTGDFGVNGPPYSWSGDLHPSSRTASRPIRPRARKDGQNRALSPENSRPEARHADESSMAGSFFSRFFTERNRKIWEKLPGPIRRLMAPALRTVIPTTMPMEKIPRVYPTLQCNLTCPFCSDGLDYDKSRMGYELLSKEKWIEVVDALPGHAVMFTGGEPTLYQPLPEVINAIHQIDVFLYTNLSYDVNKIFDRLTKPVRVFGSYHPNNKSVTAEKILNNLKILQDHPMCRSIDNIHTINHPSNGDCDAHKELFAENGIQLDILEDQFTNNANTPAACNHEKLQTVRCRYDRIIIGPDGQRWICVSKMIRNCKDGLVPVDQQSVPEMVCAEFGRCSPCDQVAEIVEYLDAKKQEEKDPVEAAS